MTATAATTSDPPLPASPQRAATRSTPKKGSNNSSGNGSSMPNTPNRPRINSRDIPRSYSGMYGQGGDDLLPFELARNWHTDWLERGEFLFIYLGGVAIFQLVVVASMDNYFIKTNYTNTRPLFLSWTVTNAVHLLLSLIYLHWAKGSYFDDQGEMSAMTLWEQLEGRPKTVATKRALTIVPTLLCYAACHFANYRLDVCIFNGILWSIHLFAKLPVMNGVRIFGINRTTGIDDYSEKQD